MEGGDKGYSPSPNIGIDEDEGYSPSPGFVSILCDHKSLLFFQSFLGPENFASVSALFIVLLCPHHASFLSFLNNIAWAQIPPSVVRSGSLTDGHSTPSPHKILRRPSHLLA
jgi:hypothetical protein